MALRVRLWALGWDPCGVYSVSGFLLGIGVGRLWRFSAFVVFLRHAGWSVYFIYLFIYLFIVWRGMAWRVAFMGRSGGALVAFTAFGAFLRRLGWSPFVAFRVFVTFMGHWGGTLMAFTVFLLFMECWGWTFVAFTAFLASIRRSGWSFWWRLEC